MMRRDLLLWLGVGVLGSVAQGFQLLRAVPPLLQQPRILHAPRKRTAAIKPASSSSTTSEVPAVSAHDDSGPERQLLDWNKQWYPVLAVKSTDPGRAHAVQLLGKDLVVWKNTEGTWATFDDRCPHRAAPLTEGRVEKDGSLLCAYHGWRFDSDGKCLSIPQSERGGKDEAQAAACAKVYPTQVAQGLIWVWGENGPDAGLESAVTPAPLVPELDDTEGIEAGRVIAGTIYQRDLAYAWETFMENVLDPSHVTVSHHGIMGTRDMAAPVKLELLTSTLSKDGFSLRNNSPVGDRVDGLVQFRAPTQVVIDAVKKDGSVIKLVSYNVPTRPGWSRMMFRQMFVTPKQSADSGEKKETPKPSLFQPHKLPDWVQHVASHKFIHQDLVFLHHQEKILASAGFHSSNYGKAVFVPASADKGVMTLRRWIKEFASGGPVWSEGCDTAMPPRERNRAALFDVYEQHTQGCTSCLGALEKANRYMAAAKASAVASLTWAILRGARAVSVSPPPSASVLSLATARAMLPGLVLMSAGLGAIKVLEIVQTSLKTGSYRHQDND